MCYLCVLYVANVLIVLPVLFRFIVAGQVSKIPVRRERETAFPIQVTKQRQILSGVKYQRFCPRSCGFNQQSTASIGTFENNLGFNVKVQKGRTASQTIWDCKTIQQSHEDNNAW
jgi:hypothetical protein